MSRTPEEIWNEFVSDGNVVKGAMPSKYVGPFGANWLSGHSEVNFGNDVTLSYAKLFFGKFGGSLSVEDGSILKGRVDVISGGSVSVGAGTVMNRACDIRAGEGASVRIGKECLFSNVSIMTSDLHSVLDVETGERVNPAADIVIEDKVWAAANVRIGKGVRVGEGAIIAANSVVTKSIPPLCLAAGTPARVIRTGVTWSRNLKKVEPRPAPAFSAKDLPLDKEILRLLFSRGEYSLIEERMLLEGDVEDLPLYAQWYFVASTFRLGRPYPDAKAILTRIAEAHPGHTAARRLLEKMGED